MHHVDTISQNMRKAIEECLSCSAMCEETISYCMDMPGSMIDAAGMRLMMDCAAITKTCADMMCRMSPMHVEMCAMCARICSMCAAMCEKMPRDPQLSKLAKACRSCMDSCTAMAGAAA